MTFQRKILIFGAVLRVHMHCLIPLSEGRACHETKASFLEFFSANQYLDFT